MKILNGKDELISSQNEYDWLGPGVYFWEQNPGRALEYSIECATNKQKFSGKIKTPFVLGALIELGNCLNMLEPNSIGIVRNSYDALVEIYYKSGKPMPKNAGANRKLDCAVISNVHRTVEKNKFPKYDTVRSAFNEGSLIYPESNFTSRLHIEICVLNAEMIKGYFLPRPIELYNPYLYKEFDKSQYKG